MCFSGTQVYTLEASARNGAGTNFQFSIFSPNNEFEIREPATGQVFLAKKLDFEVKFNIVVIFLNPGLQN